MLKLDTDSGIFGLCEETLGAGTTRTHEYLHLGNLDTHTSASQFEESDTILVRQTLNGNKRAFETLVRRYQKLVYNVSFQMNRSHESAADLTQETFLKAYRALASFKQEANFKPWLMKIATNTCLNAIRSQRPADSLDAVLDENPKLEPASAENIEMEVERRFTHQLLFSSLAQLPSRYRQIFVLRYQQDLSYDEIAETVGESTSSIKSLLFRIREKLRKIMQSSGDDDVERRNLRTPGR